MPQMLQPWNYLGRLATPSLFVFVLICTIYYLLVWVPNQKVIKYSNLTTPNRHKYLTTTFAYVLTNKIKLGSRIRCGFW